MQGMTYQQIADEMGYANAGSVYTIIKDAQARELRTALEGFRETERARLDALQHSAVACRHGRGGGCLRGNPQDRLRGAGCWA